MTDIGHAFRVTVRATNGYVYPASHRAGSTAGALPMGARLRLKTSVGGADPALRTSDPNVRKIFRAMQKYGLIVADNGSDMYITGTFDTRWNNDMLNPAFATLSASDFEVVQLGWKPAGGRRRRSARSAPNPTSVVGRQSATGTVTLTARRARRRRAGLAVEREQRHHGSRQRHRRAGRDRRDVRDHDLAVTATTSATISAVRGVTKTPC